MGRDGKTTVGKGSREREWRREGERENGRDGTGHGMGRERSKGREREERGYSPPDFNSWRRHQGFI